MNRKVIVIFVISLITTQFFSGCQKNNYHKTSYFGGKIINPKSNNVILFKNNIAMDTFYLNSNNTLWISRINYELVLLKKRRNDLINR